MKTYSEIKGEEPFNWHEFLNREDIKEEEWQVADELSSRWITCAVGNQCDVILRYETGMPLDEELALLGFDFHQFICNRNEVKAKEILAQIEARSAELITEINKGK